MVNVVLFQIGWFACVLGAAHGLPWIGALLLRLRSLAGTSRARRSRSRNSRSSPPQPCWAHCSKRCSCSLGWVHFETGVLVEGAAPYWMVALWAIFATTLNVSLRSLRPHGWLAAVLGAIGGPVAYYAGARLGALEFGAPASAPALAAIGIGWAILTPALLCAARRLDGYARP